MGAYIEETNWQRSADINKRELSTQTGPGGVRYLGDTGSQDPKRQFFIPRDSLSLFQS